MGTKRFFSPELLAAHEFLDNFIQDNRRSTSKGDNHKMFIKLLRNVRDGIEEADIALDENAGGVTT
jgi:hypothetical protein